MYHRSSHVRDHARAAVGGRVAQGCVVGRDVGRSVDLLQEGAKHRFYPAVWDVRSAMTDAWGASYGKVRESLGQGGAAETQG